MEVCLLFARMLLAFVLIFMPVAQALAIDISKYPAIQAYIQRVSTKYHFDSAQLTQWFMKAQFNPQVVSHMRQPAEAQPWYIYRNYFITPKRINDGINFWKANAAVLNKVGQEYGVPAAVIVGILGIESDYGMEIEKYYVFNSLMTLAFNYPSRSKYFESELTQFLILARERGWDPLAIKGSYAGAIGFPQFMPSSYRSYAVDYAHSTKDLLNNSVDSIASIANYLKQNAWQPNQPVAILASVSGDKYKQLINPKGSLKFVTVKQLKAYGVTPSQALSDSQKVALLDLGVETGLQHWLVFPNFKVILRYNASKRYAMAVYQLGEEIKKRI